MGPWLLFGILLADLWSRFHLLFQPLNASSLNGNGWMDGWLDGLLDGCPLPLLLPFPWLASSGVRAQRSGARPLLAGCLDGWLDGWMDGWLDGCLLPFFRRKAENSEPNCAFRFLYAQVLSDFGLIPGHYFESFSGPLDQHWWLFSSLFPGHFFKRFWGLNLDAWGFINKHLV